MNILESKSEVSSLVPQMNKEQLPEQFPISMGRHAMLSKKLTKGISEEVPVYKYITVFGKDDDGKLMTKVECVTGANTPISREFRKNFPTVSGQDIAVYTLDGDGNKVGKRVVTTGEKYHYSKELLMIKFKIPNFSIIQRATELKITREIMLHGISINSDGTCRIGGDDSFKPFIWSVSNDRNNQMLLSSVPQEQLMKIIGNVSGGLFERTGQIDYASFKKLVARFGLFQTPAIEMLSIGNDNFGVLIIDGKEESTPDFEDGIKGIESLKGDTNVWDGDTVISAELIQAFAKSKGVNLTLEESAMLNPQARVDSISVKSFASTMYPTSFSVYVKNTKEKYQTRVVGNPLRIGLVTDSDGAKTLALAIEDMMMYLLDIAKGSESKMSTQYASKVVAADNGRAMELFRSKAEDTISDFMRGIGDEVKSLSLANDIETWKTIVKMAGKDNNLGMKVANDTPFISAFLKEGNTFGKSVLKKFKINFSGVFQRVFFDKSENIGNIRILNTNNKGKIEAYSTDVLYKYRKEIAEIEEDENLTNEEKDLKLANLLTADIIKYPSAGDEEVIQVVYLTWKQILRRINEKVGLTDVELLVALRDYFKFAGYGTTVLAANNTVKRILAGFDTDYDGVVAIFDKDFVAITANRIKRTEDKIKEETGEEVVFGGDVPIIIKD